MPSGFLLIHKPAGITSFGVIAEMRRITGIKKIGHAGTLDPFATGLLIVAIGREATREISHYMKLDKTYEAVFCFGATTETLDPEKPIEKDLSFHADACSDEKIQETVAHFIGDITQIPPMHSAIKINGVRSYLLARLGKKPTVPSRTVTVVDIRIKQIERRDGCVYVKLIIDCGSGTYIRSLARDIGLALNTTGYVTELHRTRIGTHVINHAHTLHELRNSWEEYLFH